MGCNTSFSGAVALALKAGEAGADRVSQSHFNWDIAGQCHAPASFEIFARPQKWSTTRLIDLPVGVQVRYPREQQDISTMYRHFFYEKGLNHPIWVTLSVRCRKCEWCLKMRQRFWATKAQVEFEAAPRTWFATFTGSPDEHYRWRCVARMKAADGPVPFEGLPEIERFRLLCKAAGPDITRYMKRVRKQSGARIRYLFVTEKHQSGLPHWHAFIHDMDEAKPIRKAVLREQWTHGFSRFKLVDDRRAAWYLCKYLAKDLATRVRSSLNYGRLQDAPSLTLGPSQKGREILTPFPIAEMRKGPVQGAHI